MTSFSRAIKQELLEDLKPEIYLPPARPRRRPKVKVEEKVDVKTLVKAKSKKRRAAKRELEEDVEFVRRFAPRRPYQWKGRKVQAVVRPGVPVVFTPGQRTGRAVKRQYDEVYADEDVLEQAAALENEFAYGKRARVLTNSNPTPSQTPITPQEPVVRPGEARLLPTVQVLVPKNTKREIQLPVGKSEAGDVKVENKGIEQVAPGLAVQTVDIKVPIKRKRAGPDETIVKKYKEEEIVEEPYKTTVKMEYTEQPEKIVFDTGVEPGALFEARPIAVARKRRRAPALPQAEAMEIQQAAAQPVVQVQAPAAPAAALTVAPARRQSRWGPANAIFPDYRYHPSITATKLVGPAPKGRVSRWGPANSIIPEVRLHPSMVGAVVKRAAPRRRRTRRRTRRVRSRLLPDVRYHPSIVLSRRA